MRQSRPASAAKSGNRSIRKEGCWSNSDQRPSTAGDVPGRRHLTISLSDGVLQTPYNKAAGSPATSAYSASNSPAHNGFHGSRPGTASGARRNARFTCEEKACFRRVPAPSATCGQKEKYYWQTIGKVRKEMTERGLTSLPVYKGDFYNHPVLDGRQPQVKSNFRATRGARQAILEMRPGVTPLPVESIVADVLDEILPVSPANANREREAVVSSYHGCASVRNVCVTELNDISAPSHAEHGDRLKATPSPARGSSSRPKRSLRMAQSRSVPNLTEDATPSNVGQGSPSKKSITPSGRMSKSATGIRRPSVWMCKSTTSPAGCFKSTTGSPKHAPEDPVNVASVNPELLGRNVLRQFRQTILSKFSTVVEAFEAFSQDVPPERDLTKPEWRRLLAKHGFPEYAGRKEINAIFAELDFSGDNLVSIKEWYIALEMVAPIRSFEALRRRWLSSGFESMTQAMRTMSEDDDGFGGRQLTFSEFAAYLRRTYVEDDAESKFVFLEVAGNINATCCIDELLCCVAAVSPSLLLEDLRARLLNRFKGDLRKSFSALDADGSGTLQLQEFVAAMRGRLDLNRIEAEKIFREIDVDCSGEIDVDEFLAALTIVEPSLFLEELRFKVRQRYHSIKDTLNKAFADEVLDGLETNASLSIDKFQEALLKVGLTEIEISKLFRLIDNGDGELTATEFMKGVSRFAPACVLEDVRVRACQVSKDSQNIFESMGKKMLIRMNLKTFVETLVRLGLLTDSTHAYLNQPDEINGQVVFDILDVNNEGYVTLSRLAAALTSCCAGSKLRLLAKESDECVRESVHSGLIPLARQLTDMRGRLRLGAEDPAPLDMTIQEKFFGKSTNCNLHDRKAEFFNQLKIPESEVDNLGRLEPAVAGPIPRLQTATQEDVPQFLKAVPALAADCTCSAELAVFDTQHSFGKIWTHISETPAKLKPVEKVPKNLHCYFQNVVKTLSQDAPLFHKVESRMELYTSARVAEGGLKPGKSKSIP